MTPLDAFMSGLACGAAAVWILYTRRLGFEDEWEEMRAERNGRGKVALVVWSRREVPPTPFAVRTTERIVMLPDEAAALGGSLIRMADRERRGIPPDGDGCGCGDAFGEGAA